MTIIRLVMIFLLSYVFFEMVPDGHPWLHYYVVAVLLVYCLNHFLLFTRKGNRVVLPVVLIDSLLSVLYGFLFPTNTLYLIFLGIVAVTAFIAISDRKLLNYMCISFFPLWFTVMLYTWWITGELELLSQVVSASFVLFSAVVGNLIRKLLSAQSTMDRQFEELHNSHQALSEAHAQLQTYSKQVEELTTIHERNRIAREIHDTVGHKMTALLVQLELSKALLKLDLEKAEETISICENLARDALQEVRLSVRTLHEGEENLVAFIPSIRHLLEDFYQTTGLDSCFELKGDPSVIPVSLQPTLIRTIQEALTNAKRHGDATTFLLRLTSNRDEITLEAIDNGKGTGTFQPGFGLMNMKERVEEHGGSVIFHSNFGEGFVIRIHFPLLEKKWQTGGVS